MKHLTALDLAPAVDQMHRLIGDVDVVQMESPTPCEEMTVRQLLAHLLVATHFSAAAASGVEPGGEAEIPVDDDGVWRPVLVERCTALAAAWARQEAWRGRSVAGGVETSAQEAGRVAAMELVLHGWDLAVATAQPFAADDAAVAAVVELMDELQDAEARGQAFGPVIPVAAGSSLLHQALGLSGRDPGWSPASARR